MLVLCNFFSSSIFLSPHEAVRVEYDQVSQWMRKGYMARMKIDVPERCGGFGKMLV